MSIVVMAEKEKQTIRAAKNVEADLSRRPAVSLEKREVQGPQVLIEGEEPCDLFRFRMVMADGSVAFHWERTRG